MDVPVLFGTESFMKDKERDGAFYQIIGSVSANHGLVNNSFSGRFGVFSSGTIPKKIKLNLEHIGFGIIGSGGVGKVYDKTLTNTCVNKRNCNLDMSRDYSASVAYSKTYAYADITSKNGKKWTFKGI